MTVDRCHDCQASLGTMTQETLFNEPKRCPVCQRNHMAGSYLKLLSEPGEREWSGLTEWEQEFVTSVRRQFAQKATVSEKQWDILERIYRKTA